MANDVSILVFEYRNKLHNGQCEHPWCPLPHRKLVHKRSHSIGLSPDSIQPGHNRVSPLFSYPELLSQIRKGNVKEQAVCSAPHNPGCDNQSRERLWAAVGYMGMNRSKNLSLVGPFGGKGAERDLQKRMEWSEPHLIVEIVEAEHPSRAMSSMVIGPEMALKPADIFRVHKFDMMKLCHWADKTLLPNQCIDSLVLYTYRRIYYFFRGPWSTIISWLWAACNYTLSLAAQWTA